ncbi:MAG: hypothetical protein MJD61_18340, partial [Proteobacteria bacterium]|nr:hypothetical protein [Pseudomonadota bacterium]
ANNTATSFPGPFTVPFQVSTSSLVTLQPPKTALHSSRLHSSKLRGFEPHGFEPHGFEPHGFEPHGMNTPPPDDLRLLMGGRLRATAQQAPAAESLANGDRIVTLKSKPCAALDRGSQRMGGEATRCAA